LKDDGIDIDLLSCEEIEGALNFLEIHKAVRSDSKTSQLFALHQISGKYEYTLPTYRKKV
jgi:hypothetical protein